jgi:monofunctional biosynthetic peptidoglycan transglycosylase
MSKPATRSKRPGTRRRKSTRRAPKPKLPLRQRVRRMAVRAVLGLIAVTSLLIVLFAIVRPPFTPYMAAEQVRLGTIEQDWVAFDDIAPVMARAAVAAEDANFCLHWGLDIAAIRTAIDTGAGRGASTISQQTVKNVFLWQGRSWLRKALEAVLTPAVEAIWSKRRILEVYLNVAEFGEGVFGVQAAAQHYFGVDAVDLSGTQAARLAAILPDPKGRSASNPSNFVRQQAARILDGAATIAVDGRAACFER